MVRKSAEAFRTISEVADLLGTPAHVLRFWESRFTQVKPVKRAGGRRYYRPGDVALLDGIRKLLHEDGITIRGVQKILKENGVKHVSALSSMDAAEPQDPAKQAPEPPRAPKRSARKRLEEAPAETDSPELPFDNIVSLSPAPHPSKDGEGQTAPPAPAAEQTAAPPSRGSMPPEAAPRSDDATPLSARLRSVPKARLAQDRDQLAQIYTRLGAVRGTLRKAHDRSGS